MTRRADEPSASEVAATLELIDATLAGAPVDPGQAEVAELVLFVAGERPPLREQFAHDLDRRVESRFGAASKMTARKRRGRPRRRWRWALAPAVVLVAAAALVAIVVVARSGSSTSSSGTSSSALSVHTTARHGRGAALMIPPRAVDQGPRGGANASSPGALASPGLQPPANGRKLIQSSQLSLGAPPDRIDAVAQEVFNVVGAQNGFVDSSTVTATGGTGGYARFRLTVPSATLPQTMTDLSRLRYATVLSRTDNVEDVTGQLQSAKHHHQRARVRALERGIAYSSISLSVQADAPSASATRHSHGGNFTIGGAAHDALGVLTVIGGIALIALAVLVPIAAMAALGWQLRTALRRRQREHSLDLA